MRAPALCASLIEAGTSARTASANTINPKNTNSAPLDSSAISSGIADAVVFKYATAVNRIPCAEIVF